MFTAKRLADGAILYHSRVTGIRYVISQTLHGLQYYIDGMAIHVNAYITRRDILDAIEFYDGVMKRTSNLSR